ncbi:farnesol dehydrogenase-like [Chrysoperla carnea]|uniref:farnesol dehydrogenase-like n=1 Tax=Chrysoperla carnea TaxID=189513 RepID=UPI001D09097E|nr:farnesol dehydrogenase-like [Chrysoperla carnea]
MTSLKGKVALVTGASSGNGQGITRALVKHGMIVVGVARRLDRLEALAKELKNEPGKFHYLQVDMLKEDQILSAFQFIKKEFGALHVLVNNAGVARNTSLSDGDTKLWKEVLDTNILSLAIATREAVRMMEETKVEGYIVHINSIFGLTVPYKVGKDLNMYATSKYGVTAMTEALRLEILNKKLKIRVTSICPGVVATELLQAAKMEKFGEQFKDNPILKTEDIAATVIFLITLPGHVEIPSLTIRPLWEQF